MKLLSVILALTVLASSVCADTYPSAAMGRLLCRVGNTFYPIREVTVKLLDKNIFRDDLIGEIRSDTNGNFFISGTSTEFISKPDPYIKVVYQYTGVYGQMEVNGLLSSQRSDRTGKQPYKPLLDLRDVIFSGDHCRAYVKFYNALADYYNRTGQAFPVQPLHIRTQATLQIGRPYSEIKTVNIPESYPVTFKTANVQLAHILRHSMDGSMAHLLKDAVRFSYTSPHSCDAPTNEGFAFDEGFARFWAGDCITYPYYGYSLRDYTIEGNVANALRRLQARCGRTDADMIEVLRRNPGRIHSFQEYEKASGCPDFPFQPSMPPNTIRPTGRTTPYTLPEIRTPSFGITGFAAEEAKEQEERKKEEMLAVLKELLESE